MKTKIKFDYPSSEKVYLKGKLFPDLRVGMRKVRLTPTVTFEGDVRHENPMPLSISMIRVVAIATPMWK